MATVLGTGYTFSKNEGSQAGVDEKKGRDAVGKFSREAERRHGGIA